MTNLERHEAAKDTIEALHDKERVDRDILDDLMFKDLNEHKKIFADRDMFVYDKYKSSNVLFSQFDMALVHMAFFTSVVTFPE